MMPEEAKALLREGNDREKAALEGKWINFAGLGEPWGM